MRWWLFGTVLIIVVIEGLVLINWPVLDIKLPVTWLTVYLLAADEWVGLRQGLLMAAASGYVLDVLAAPVPGSVLLPMILAWAVSSYVLARYKRTRNSKVGAFGLGTLVFMGGSLVNPGPYLPVWTGAVWMAASYLLVSTAVFLIIDSTIKLWLKRV